MKKSRSQESEARIKKPTNKKEKQVKIDLSEISRLKDDLRQKTEDLQACRRRLEALVRAISHDLRTPVISVQGFANLLYKKYRDRMDEKGIQYLDHLKREADRIDRILQDFADKSGI